jgi:amidase
MTIREPSLEEIEGIADQLGLDLSVDDLESFRNLTTPMILSLTALDQIPDEWPAVKWPRTPGTRPSLAENPLGAWYVKSRIEGASSGALAGRTVAVKDNVMVAGVPMSNGTSILDGYIPPVDATVVTRILDAGGTILGKAVCESYCLSGGSHTSDTGPVRNPHDPARTAGGSSSGSAALVASGEVDLAIGGDQGGSIRMPASFCGIVGMKPTHGLVPYTGILGLEPTIDHTGPMTATVADNALFLEVIAGADGLDGRQVAPRTARYTEALGQGAEGLRIGLLREGFGHPTAEDGVEEAVRAGADRLGALGAKVSEVSVPMHALFPLLAGPIFQSAMSTVFHTDGCGTGREDVYVPSFADRQRTWRDRANELPDTVKTFLISSEIMRSRYGWRYYAKAMNQVRALRAAYDAALAEVDVLVLPTTPMVAPLLPQPGASLEERVAAAWSPIVNTQNFDHSHHPALSIPCGTVSEMPVGMMLVGRAYEESTLYQAASALEA